MSDIGERVKKSVGEHLGHEAAQERETANFIDHVRAESVSTVERVMAFEEEFNV